MPFEQRLERKLLFLEDKLSDEFKKAIEALEARVEAIEEGLRTSDKHTASKKGVITDFLKSNAQQVELNDDLIPGRVMEAEDVPACVVPTPLPTPVVPRSTQASSSRRSRLSRPGSDSSLIQEKVDIDLIPHGDSVWNLLIVVGFSGASWSELVVGWILFMLNIVASVCFLAVVASDSFQGDPVNSEVSAANQYRLSVAHDYLNLDTSKTQTLAYRVCNDSPLLITSQPQSFLIQAIQSYLGNRHPTESETWGPPIGAVLLMTCVIAWYLAVCRQVRVQWSRVVVLISIPRSSRTMIVNGVCEQISYARAMAMLVITVGQGVFAACLFVWGTIWLSHTTAFSDLILNFAALAAVLEVDELIFDSLFPRKLQFAIQSLEAVRVERRYRDNLCETFVLFLMTILAAVATYFSFLHGDDGILSSMQAIRQELCGGNLDFVVRYNPNTQQVYWLDTSAANYDGFGALQEAVSDLKNVSGMAGNGRRAHKVSGYKELEAKSEQQLETFLTARNQCQDYSDEREQAVQFQNTALVHSLDVDWATLKILTGTSTAQTCGDMKTFCDNSSLPMVRFLCPVTCQCSAFLERGYLRTHANGCDKQCLDDNNTFVTLCRDDLVAKPDWDLFWDLWLNHSSDFSASENSSHEDALAIHSEVKAMGCNALNESGGLEYLCWEDASWRGLAAMCPETCRCHELAQDDSSSIALCPEACLRQVKGGVADSPEWQNCVDFYTTSKCVDAAWLPAPLPDNCSQYVALGMCDSNVSSTKNYCLSSCGQCLAEFSSLCTQDTPDDGKDWG